MLSNTISEILVERSIKKKKPLTFIEFTYSNNNKPNKRFRDTNIWIGKLTRYATGATRAWNCFQLRFNRTRRRYR